MENDTIKFTYNWNGKLNNKAFTTIRMHNPKKYIIGKTYHIELSGQRKGKATIQDKRVLTIDKLNDFICYMDTGYNRSETINILGKMYNNIDLRSTLFDFCLLVYHKNPTQQPEPPQMSLEI